MAVCPGQHDPGDDRAPTLRPEGRPSPCRRRLHQQHPRRRHEEQRVKQDHHSLSWIRGEFIEH